MGTRKLDEISNQDVAQLEASMKLLSSKTVNNALNVLSKALNVATELGLIDEPPCKVKLLRRAQAPEMPFYDFEQHARLVDAARRFSPEAHLTVLLGGDAGLRSGEITALEWGDVDLERGSLLIQRAQWRKVVGLPKGKKSRRVPMTSDLKAALKTQRERTQLKGPRVLLAAGGGAAKHKALRDWLRSAQKLAGVEIPTEGVAQGLHILRHSFCSHLAMRGAPAKAIQELAGHESITTTNRYMHLSPSAKSEAIGLLDDRNRVGAAGRVPMASRESRRSESEAVTGRIKAGCTGLEPVAFRVTGWRYSQQLTPQAETARNLQ